MAEGKGNIIEMPESYGYEGRAGHAEHDEVTEEVEELPIAKIEEWLDPEAELPTKWVELASGKARILIKAMSQKQFKSLRGKAPMKKNRAGKLARDNDWVENHMLLECVVEPKIPHVSLLEHALAGDLTNIVLEITKLSGFDVDSVLRDALE